MRRRIGALLLAVALLAVCCAPVICLGAHLHCCPGARKCAACPAALTYLFLLGQLLPLAGLVCVRLRLPAARCPGPALALAFAPRTPVSDGTLLRD